MEAILRKVIAAVVAAVQLATGALLSHAREVNLWAERRRSQAVQLASAAPSSAARISAVMPQAAARIAPSPALKKIPPALLAAARALPATAGSLQKVTLPSSGRTERVVVHIQDVHLNVEAQTAIGQAVAAAVRGGAELVALEGLFDELDVSSVRRFPHRDAIGKAADYLLRAGEISGAVHAAFTGSGAFPSIVGVDDRVLYDRNVNAYLASRGSAEAVRASVDSERRRLEKEKASVFHPELASLDKVVADYHQGRASIGIYARTLVAKAGSEAAHASSADRERRLGESPASVLQFLEALALEESLDFARVERERALLLDALVSRLTSTDAEALLQQSLACRTGALSHTDFYEALRALCRAHGVDSARYPAMDRYFRYVALSDAIDADRLLADLADLEKNAAERAARTDHERALIAASRRLGLLDKLTTFSLTPAEWEEWKAVPSPKSRLPRESVSLLTGEAGGRDAGEGDNGINSFELFYESARSRDHAMAENLLRAMEKAKVSSVVLVAGGYHAPGVARALAKKGVATIAFRPRLIKADVSKGSEYLGAFAQEKTPLETLFAGQRLFVSPPPAKGGRTLPVIVIGVLSLMGALFGALETHRELAPSVPVAEVRVEGTGPRDRRVVVKTDQGTARITVNVDADSNVASVEQQLEKEGGTGAAGPTAALKVLFPAIAPFLLAAGMMIFRKQEDDALHQSDIGRALSPPAGQFWEQIVAAAALLHTQKRREMLRSVRRRLPSYPQEAREIFRQLYLQSDAGARPVSPVLQIVMEDVFGFYPGSRDVRRKSLWRKEIAAEAIVDALGGHHSLLGEIFGRMLGAVRRASEGDDHAIGDLNASIESEDPQAKDALRVAIGRLAGNRFRLAGRAWAVWSRFLRTGQGRDPVRTSKTHPLEIDDTPRVHSRGSLVDVQNQVRQRYGYDSLEWNLLSRMQTALAPRIPGAQTERIAKIREIVRTDPLALPAMRGLANLVRLHVPEERRIGAIGLIWNEFLSGAGLMAVEQMEGGISLVRQNDFLLVEDVRAIAGPAQRVFDDMVNAVGGHNANRVRVHVNALLAGEPASYSRYPSPEAFRLFIESLEAMAHGRPVSGTLARVMVLFLHSAPSSGVGARAGSEGEDFKPYVALGEHVEAMLSGRARVVEAYRRMRSARVRADALERQRAIDEALRRVSDQDAEAIFDAIEFLSGAGRWPVDDEIRWVRDTVLQPLLFPTVAAAQANKRHIQDLKAQAGGELTLPQTYRETESALRRVGLERMLGGYFPGVVKFVARYLVAFWREEIAANDATFLGRHSGGTEADGLRRAAGNAILQAARRVSSFAIGAGIVGGNVFWFAPSFEPVSGVLPLIIAGIVMAGLIMSYGSVLAARRLARSDPTGRPMPHWLSAATFAAALPAMMGGALAHAFWNPLMGIFRLRHSLLTFPGPIHAPLLFPVLRSNLSDIQEMTVAPDGQTLAVRYWQDENLQLRLFTRQGDAWVPAAGDVPELGNIGDATFSPDGQTLAVRHVQGGSWRLRLLTRQGDAWVPADGDVPGLEAVMGATFSPDSQTLAVWHGQSGNWRLRLLTRQGDAWVPATEDVLGLGSVVGATFSPDGQTLAVWHEQGGNQSLRLLMRQGGAWVPAAGDVPGLGTVWGATFSSDGQTLAVRHGQGGNQRLRLLTRQGDAWVPAAGDVPGLRTVWGATFSSDGQTLVVRHLHENWRLRLLTRQGDAWVPAAGDVPGLGDVVVSATFSPDGQTLAVRYWQNENLQLRLFTRQGNAWPASAAQLPDNAAAASITFLSGANLLIVDNGASVSTFDLAFPRQPLAALQTFPGRMLSGSETEIPLLAVRDATGFTLYEPLRLKADGSVDFAAMEALLAAVGRWVASPPAERPAPRALLQAVLNLIALNDDDGAVDSSVRPLVEAMQLSHLTELNALAGEERYSGFFNEYFGTTVFTAPADTVADNTEAPPTGTESADESEGGTMSAAHGLPFIGKWLKAARTSPYLTLRILEWIYTAILAPLWETGVFNYLALTYLPGPWGLIVAIPVFVLVHYINTIINGDQVDARELGLRFFWASVFYFAFVHGGFWWAFGIHAGWNIFSMTVLGRKGLMSVVGAPAKPLSGAEELADALVGIRAAHLAGRKPTGREIADVLSRARFGVEGIVTGRRDLRDLSAVDLEELRAALERRLAGEADQRKVSLAEARQWLLEAGIFGPFEDVKKIPAAGIALPLQGRRALGANGADEKRLRQILSQAPKRAPVYLLANAGDSREALSRLASIDPRVWIEDSMEDTLVSDDGGTPELRLARLEARLEALAERIGRGNVANLLIAVPPGMEINTEGYSTRRGSLVSTVRFLLLNALFEGIVVRRADGEALTVIARVISRNA